MHLRLHTTSAVHSVAAAAPSPRDRLAAVFLLGAGLPRSFRRACHLSVGLENREELPGK